MKRVPVTDSNHYNTQTEVAGVNSKRSAKRGRHLLCLRELQGLNATRTPYVI